MRPVFSDHFSGVASSYATYRPRYPGALMDWLATLTPRHAIAWDCGTGSGQAAVALAGRFADVIATDPSTAQLVSAERVAGVSYAAMTAERSALAASSVDLVTVAQALHWFDHRAFFAEADRVLRPGGALGVWSYGLITVDPAVDELVRPLYHDLLGPYWPAERALVDAGYAGIELPYAEVEAPPFTMEATWDLAQFGGYLSTWSAVSRYRRSTGRDPVEPLLREVSTEWSTTERRRVCWPLVVRAGRKHL
jgi:SAM-dependent methyltransferase